MLSRFVLCYLALLTIGVGSWLFHMTLLYEMQLLDEIPMVFGSAMITYSISQVSMLLISLTYITYTRCTVCNSKYSLYRPVDVVILCSDAPACWQPEPSHGHPVARLLLPLRVRLPGDPQTAFSRGL